MTTEPSATQLWLDSNALIEQRYEFTLFVSGASDLAARAVANARHLFETHLSGRYEMSVVDIQDDIEALISSGVLATPTLVKNNPLPERRAVGDLSSSSRVLAALGLSAAEVPPGIVET